MKKLGDFPGIKSTILVLCIILCCHIFFLLGIKNQRIIVGKSWACWRWNHFIYTSFSSSTTMLNEISLAKKVKAVTIGQVAYVQKYFLRLVKTMPATNQLETEKNSKLILYCLTTEFEWVQLISTYSMAYWSIIYVNQIYRIYVLPDVQWYFDVLGWTFYPCLWK